MKTTVFLCVFTTLFSLQLQGVMSLQFQHHPLDPLTKEEFTIVQTTVLEKYPPSSKNKVAFHYIGLDDPDKHSILKWEMKPTKLVTIPRKAFVIVIINNIQTYEIVIDLRLKRIVSDNVHKGHGFPLLSVDEISAAIQLPLTYPPFIASVNKRSLNISEVVCSTFTMGWFGEDNKSSRTVRIDCFMKENTVNIYVRPITGLTIVADLVLMKIVEYHDRDVEVVPTAENTEYRASHQNPPFGPKQSTLATHQPQGPGFQINCHSVR